jgi:pyridoxamine 5'-phosphate oxidase
VTRLPLPPEVLERFRKLQERAARTDLPEPTAVALATAGRDGRPSCRMVLLKAFDERGFVFYTNLESRKGHELRENPRAALTFYWPPLAEQVQVQGEVEAVSDAEADAYWVTRPRESRLGAWASLQSQPMPSRWTLLRRFVEAARRFGVGEVPRPAHWSGMRILPDRIEFWKSSRYRLHDREEWSIEEGRWVRRRLYP